jgi:hypothetical protein
MLRAAPLPATLRISAFKLIAIFLSFYSMFVYVCVASKGATRGILLPKSHEKSSVF